MNRLKKHIEHLAQKNGIRVFYVDDNRCRASVPFRQIYVSPIRKSRDYAIALHELGHVALLQLPWRPPTHARLVAEELAAWQWAFDNAAYWDEDCRRAMREGLGSYLYAKAVECVQIITAAQLIMNRCRYLLLSNIDKSSIKGV